jgi:GNAT superfamily N-acetyltransferase
MMMPNHNNNNHNNGMTAAQQQKEEATAEAEAPHSVALVAKRGPHSKWFDAYAARVAGPLLEAAFGLGCTKATVRAMDVRFIATLTLLSAAEDKKVVVAVALVTPTPEKEGWLKVQGVCVAPGLRGRKYGTRLMAQLPGLLPPTTKGIELCVDLGTETTESLREWYEKLGYEWRGCCGGCAVDEALMVLTLQ